MPLFPTKSQQATSPSGPIAQYIPYYYIVVSIFFVIMQAFDKGAVPGDHPATARKPASVDARILAQCELQSQLLKGSYDYIRGYVGDYIRV